MENMQTKFDEILSQYMYFMFSAELRMVYQTSLVNSIYYFGNLFKGN